MDVTDLHSLIGACDFCGTAYRYEHLLSHPEVTEEHAVGCVCSEKLTEDYVNPKQIERELRNKSKERRTRLKGWIWLESYQSYGKEESGYYVRIFPTTTGKWRIRVGGVVGKKEFSTASHAAMIVPKAVAYVAVTNKDGR